MKKIIFLLLFHPLMIFSMEWLMEEYLPSWETDSQLSPTGHVKISCGIWATPDLSGLNLNYSNINRLRVPKRRLSLDERDAKIRELCRRRYSKSGRDGRLFFDDIMSFLNSGGDPNKRNKFGRPLISSAVIAGNIEAFELLSIHPDIDLNMQDRHGLTSLHYAARTPSPTLVFLLLTHGADPLVIDCYGRRPIDYTDHEVLRDILIARMAAVSQPRTCPL